MLMSRLREGRANTARGAAHFLRETVGRVRYARARGQLTVRADSGFYTHAVVAVCRRMDVRFSITIRQRQSLHNLIEAIPEADWTPIPYWMDGAADVAETTYTPFQSEPDATPVRLIVRRVKPTPGSQLALFATYSYHGFITDRDGDTLELEADHRRHAEIENAIRDLKYGVGLNHLPSGRFPANAAWLAAQVMAHNLARWTARLGLGEQIVTTKTLRRRFFALAGRLTRSARRLTLHLPRRWPWEEQVQPRPRPAASHPIPSLTAHVRKRPNASKLASARYASASCCARSHYHAIPSRHRPLSRPGAAAENPLPCHIGPNGAQAFSLVGSLIPICPAFTPPIGGFGFSLECHQGRGRGVVRGLLVRQRGRLAADEHRCQQQQEGQRADLGAGTFAKSHNLLHWRPELNRDWDMPGTRRPGGLAALPRSVSLTVRHPGAAPPGLR